jgi:hypothetical protein
MIVAMYESTQAQEEASGTPVAVHFGLEREKKLGGPLDLVEEVV